MRTLCIEGIASHDNPESCTSAREGRSEALTGAHAGTDIEPRNHIDRGADAVHFGGRQNGMVRHRKHHHGPARSKTRSMREISMRENREIPWLPVLDGEAGRIGKAKAASR
jgi:hypothetical protein